jgi:MFS family permease
MTIPPTPPQKISRTAWITLGILGSTLLITMYGETMLLPAIPDIIKEFNIPYDTSSWILSSYLIAGAVATPIVGRLSDIYGRKKMVTIIMIIYIIGISLGGFSPDISFLIISRVIQGIGISMFPVAFGIIRDQLPERKLAIGVGIFSSMFAAGSVVGLALGANIIDNFGWRATFFSIVFIAIGLWFVIKRFVCDGPRENNGAFSTKSNEILALPLDKLNEREVKSAPKTNAKAIDLKGTISLAVTVVSFLMVLSYSQEIDVTRTSLILFLIVGTISLIGFIFVERRSEFPLVNLQILTDRYILSANVILIIAFLCMFTVFQTIPVLVRSPIPLGFGGDAITSADIQLPFMIVFLLFAPSSGYIISALGNVKPTLIGSIVSAIGFFSLFAFHSTGFFVSMNLAIIAGGLSLMQVGGFDIVLQQTPRQFSGISLGMTVLFNLIGGSIGPAIAGIIMQTQQVILKDVVGSFPAPQSYDLIFLAIALTSLLPIVLAIFLMKKLMPVQSMNDPALTKP